MAAYWESARRHLQDTGICAVPAAGLEDLDTKGAFLRFRQRLALSHDFPFLKEKGHVISIVGAGGKTALMHMLASYSADLGHKVIVTATTHIMLLQAGAEHVVCMSCRGYCI